MRLKDKRAQIRQYFAHAQTIWCGRGYRLLCDLCRIAKMAEKRSKVANQLTNFAKSKQVSKSVCAHPVVIKCTSTRQSVAVTRARRENGDTYMYDTP